jgi:CheY-like chemotaxis protein
MRQHLVLLVEDDDDLRALYGFFLASAGFQVKAVKDGFEALSELQDQVADVIVTDLSMPVLDGIELIGIIKNRVDLANIPIIAMTSYGQTLQERAITAGADKVAGKPTDSRTLRNLIDSVLTQP